MLEVKAGMVQGREHARKGVNCQDAFNILQGEIHGQRFIVGVTADGCGDGSRSEVGANLAVQFICTEVRKNIGLIGLAAIPDVIYKRLKDYLAQLVNAHDLIDPRERVSFIKEHLLFTVMGFIVFGDQALYFTSGDGVVVVDDEVIIIDEQNRPSYIAYHLVDREMLKLEASELPYGFSVQNLNLEELSKFAIGSDAWADETELLEQVWNLGTNPRSLQRKMRVWSNAKHFSDDAVLITLENEVLEPDSAETIYAEAD